MAGSLPQSIPPAVKTTSTELNKRPKRRAQRAFETSPKSRESSGGFLLPGRSLTVGPAPSTQRPAPPAPDNRGGDRGRLVSEALRIDLPDRARVDDSKWLLSKLPEIVEQCCRQQENGSRVVEILPQPVRRKIRINVTSNHGSASPERRQDGRQDDPQEESADEFVLDGAGLRRSPRSRSTSRRQRRPAFRAAASSASSLESARRSARGDAATAELVRRVLEEMFGPRPAAGDASEAHKLALNPVRSWSRSCQTSPRLISGLSGTSVGSSGGDGAGGRQAAEVERRGKNEAVGATEAAAQTDSFQQPPPMAIGGPPSLLPQPNGASSRILDTLTESNRLLRQMSEFFRRAELNERITQRAGTGNQASPRAELERAEREGRITQRPRETGDDVWRFLDAPTAGGGGTARSDGAGSRGDGPPPDALRHCSESELSARVRRHADAAEQGLTVRSWERQQQHGSPAPLASPPPSSASPWGSPRTLELHGEDRPYRPLASPPPREADTRRSAGPGEGPRTSSPLERAPAAGPPCCHRQVPADIDSTEVLLNYDPWEAIENDFRTLLT